MDFSMFAITLVFALLTSINFAVSNEFGSSNILQGISIEDAARDIFNDRDVITYQNFTKEFYYQHCGNKTEIFDIIDVNGNDVIENVEMLFMVDNMLNGSATRSESDDFVWFLNETQNAGLKDMVDENMNIFDIDENYRKYMTVATLTNITMTQLGEFIAPGRGQFYLNYIPRDKFDNFYDEMIIAKEWDIINDNPESPSTQISREQFRESLSKLKCADHRQMWQDIVSIESFQSVIYSISWSRDVPNRGVNHLQLLQRLNFPLNTQSPHRNQRLFRRRLAPVDPVAGATLAVTGAVAGGLAIDYLSWAAFVPPF